MAVGGPQNTQISQKESFKVGIIRKMARRGTEITEKMKGYLWEV